MATSVGVGAGKETESTLLYNCFGSQANGWRRTCWWGEGTARPAVSTGELPTLLTRNRLLSTRGDDWRLPDPFGSANCAVTRRTGRRSPFPPVVGLVACWRRSSSTAGDVLRAGDGTPSLLVASRSGLPVALAHLGGPHPKGSAVKRLLGGHKLIEGGFNLPFGPRGEVLVKVCACWGDVSQDGCLMNRGPGTGEPRNDGLRSPADSAWLALGLALWLGLGTSDNKPRSKSNSIRPMPCGVSSPAGGWTWMV